MVAIGVLKACAFSSAASRMLRAAESQAARPARAKSVVFLYQFGGPSHVDTFDMKPEAPDGVRSHFGQIATSVPGLPICELLPETGLPREWERVLSSPFVLHPEYGTRSSTVVLIDRDGALLVRERRFEPSGNRSGETEIELARGAWP